MWASEWASSVNHRFARCRGSEWGRWNRRRRRGRSVFCIMCCAWVCVCVCLGYTVCCAFKPPTENIFRIKLPVKIANVSASPFAAVCFSYPVSLSLCSKYLVSSAICERASACVYALYFWHLVRASNDWWNVHLWSILKVFADANTFHYSTAAAARTPICELARARAFTWNFIYRSFAPSSMPPPQISQIILVLVFFVWSQASSGLHI